MKKIFYTALVLLGACSVASAQTLRPGFDKEEYRQLMLISARTTADSNYYKDFPAPASFKMQYQSPVMGLDNLWDLWTNDQGVAVVSVRGTTEKPESWLGNFYAAMVPAKGQLKLSNQETFDYQLAANPRAAVHVGWLLSMAYLSKDILPKINELYASGTREVYLMGHSQGGAIVFLLTAYLHSLQQTKALPADIRFKTYCSAGPKPGNLYFAQEYEALTQNGWAYNVVNAADWVPETPMSIQTVDDFNPVNPFVNAKLLIKRQKFPKNLVLRHVYNQLDKPTRRAQANYQRYLGEATGKIIRQTLRDFTPPVYYGSNHYVRTGATIVLLPDDAYFKDFPNDPAKLFTHHFHKPYLRLLDQTPLASAPANLASVAYTPSPDEVNRAKQRTTVAPQKKVFIHSLLGAQAPDFGALNTALVSSGLAPLNQVYLSRGGGFYTIFPRAHLATLFNFVTYSGEQTTGGNTSAVRGTTVGTSLGISVFKSTRYQLIPFGGLVYGWFGARLASGNAPNPTFGGYLGGGANQQYIATEGWRGNVGLHLAMTQFIRGTLGQSITVGIRPGYYLPREQNKWTTNGTPLAGGPSVNAHGWYCHLLVGLAL